MTKAPASTAGKTPLRRAPATTASRAPASTAGKAPPRSYGTREDSRPPSEPPGDNGAFADLADGVYRCKTCGWEIRSELGCCEGAGAGLVRSSPPLRLTPQVDDTVEDGDEVEMLEPYSRRFVSWPRGDTPQLEDGAKLEADPSGRLDESDYSELLHRGCTDAMIQRYALEWTYETGIVAILDGVDDNQIIADEIGTSATSVRLYLGRVALLDDSDADGSHFVHRLWTVVEDQHTGEGSATDDVFDARYRWTITAPDAEAPSVAVVKLTLPSAFAVSADSYAGSDVTLVGSDVDRSTDESDDPDVDDLAMGDAVRPRWIKAIGSDEDEGADELMSDVEDAALAAELRDKAAAVEAWRG